MASTLSPLLARAETSQPVGYPSVSLSSNRIQQILRLFDDDAEVGPLRFADATQGRAFQTVCRSIAQNRLSTQALLLTTGLGLPQDGEVPVRLPVAIIPGLRVLESCRNVGLPLPQYRIYQATGFIIGTNGNEAAGAHVCAERMQRYLRQYVQRFHSHVAEAVSIDCVSDNSAVMVDALTQTRDLLKKLLSDSEPLRAIFSSLRDCNDKHSRQGDRSLEYAAANVLLNGALPQYRSLFSDDRIPHNGLMLPIAGSYEQSFFQLTAAVANKESDPPLCIPFLTGVKARPPYYRATALGDPLIIEDYIAHRSTIRDAALQRDFSMLDRDGATLDLLQDCFPHYQ